LTRRLGGVWCLLVAAKALAAAPDSALADKLVHAKAEMRVLTDSVQSIERLRPLAEGRAVRASCVAEKLAEARAAVQIGSNDLAVVEAVAQEMTEHPAPPADAQAKRQAEDLAHALTRLEMLADRAREAIRGARVCVNDDDSAVTVTRVEVEIAPTTSSPDPTALPPAAPPDPTRPAKN